MEEKEKIISFSKDKFLSEGFYKITMDEIANGLRMSKKTIYKYFISKDILVEAAVKLFQSIMQSKIDSIIKSDSNSIIKIKKLTNMFAEISLKVNSKMMNDLQTHRPDLWQDIEEFRTRNIEKLWKNIFDQGKKEGYIIDYPSEIMVQVIISAMQGIINPNFLINHNLSIKDAFEITFGMLINGVLTESGKKIYIKTLKENKE
ncbi:MAG: TetR/AcrR family transcriptional regulator [Ignavibacteriales bacterium]|nr:TetR/AcrR family transcriptional regulator [Ignavibacteriales bacterium]